MCLPPDSRRASPACTHQTTACITCMHPSDKGTHHLCACTCMPPAPMHLQRLDEASTVAAFKTMNFAMRSPKGRDGGTLFLAPSLRQATCHQDCQKDAENSEFLSVLGWLAPSPCWRALVPPFRAPPLSAVLSIALRAEQGGTSPLRLHDLRPQYWRHFMISLLLPVHCSVGLNKY